MSIEIAQEQYIQIKLPSSSKQRITHTLTVQAKGTLACIWFILSSLCNCKAGRYLVFLQCCFESKLNANLFGEFTMKPEHCQRIFNELPQTKQRISLILYFLKLQVLSRQQKDKINHQNMSICFCPCIFQSQTPTLTDSLNSGKFAETLSIFSTGWLIIDRSDREVKRIIQKQRKISIEWQSYRISKVDFLTIDIFKIDLCPRVDATVLIV